MQALVYRGPENLRREDIARPKAGPGEVIVKVLACGVCGTDQRIVSGAHRAYGPGTVRVPGHEIVGEIVEAGGGISGSLPSGPLVVAPNYGCGRCRECLAGENNRCLNGSRALGITEDGGFAEFVLVPAAAVAQGNLLPLVGADPTLGVLVEPLATVVRGQNLLDIGPADSVLIVGGGPIGCLHAALASLKGARLVILSDHWDERLKIARAVGADITINPKTQDLAAEVSKTAGGNGVDVVILAAPSHQAQADAMGLAATGGRISFFAGLPRYRPSVEIETNLIHYKELRVSGTTACSTLDCVRATELVAAGRMNLSPLLTRSVSLAEGASIFTSVNRADLKVAIVP